MLFFPSATPFGPPDPWDDTEISEEGADFLSALSFTVALWQIMLPLLAGGAILCLVAWACEHAGRALHRQYQIRMRRGYYWFERREEEARRKFAEGCRELIGTPGDYSRRYRALLDAFRSELNEIEEERRRDWAEHWKPDPAFAWSSPKAVVGRERRRAKHAAAWRAWAEKFAAAVRLGKAPPDPPSGRRGGNGGAPIRRLCERSLNPPPTPEALAAQWEKAHGRGPVEEKIRLGSMMLDIEATVDSSLVRNTDGEIVGRNPGLRGWLRENCPAMMGHYRVLMDCRQLADKFRKVHGVRDPLPAAILLEKELTQQPDEGLTDRSCLSVEGIVDFADSVDLGDVREILERQIQYNMAIAAEGLRGDYGANIGKTVRSAAPAARTSATACWIPPPPPMTYPAGTTPPCAPAPWPRRPPMSGWEAAPCRW